MDEEKLGANGHGSIKHTVVRKSSISTCGTANNVGADVHLMSCLLSSSHFSPPFGDNTVIGPTTGGVCFSVIINTASLSSLNGDSALPPKPLDVTDILKSSP